jgi:hypothetical protein
VGLPAGQQLSLNSLEEHAETSKEVPPDLGTRLTDQGVQYRTRELAIEIGRGPFPALFFRPPKLWDVREWGEIAYDIANPGSTPVRFRVRFDDDYRDTLASRDPVAFGRRGLPTSPRNGSFLRRRRRPSRCSSIRFGQFAPGRWPGKTFSEEEMVEGWAAE